MALDLRLTRSKGSVSKGLSKIARRLIAGITTTPSASPEGTTEGGNAAFSRPSGTSLLSAGRSPDDESSGYFRAPLSGQNAVAVGVAIL
jgi:hypothetical protein